MAAPKVALVAFDLDREFVRRDLAILEGLGAEVRATGTNPFEIRRAARWASHVVAWFLGEHAFYAVWYARRRRIPSLVLLGGLERTADPELGYGLWLRPWHVRVRCRWALRRATELWSVEPSLAEDTLRMGRASRDYRTVPTEFDPEAFRPLDKDGTVALACSKGEAGYAARKGLPTFLEAARQLPEHAFRVIGRDPTEGAPANVAFTGYLSRQHYADILARTSVIVNASKYEGLSNVLCEGMLAGALPVVSDIPGNLYAVGDLPGRGFAWSFAYGRADELARGVRLALDASTPTSGAAVRQTVLDRFPRDARREAFAAFLSRTG